MKTRAAIILSLSLGLLSANTAMANDAVLGAIVGGGLGAVVGNHVGGREGAAIMEGHALAQDKGPFQQIGGTAPGFSQVRLDAHIDLELRIPTSPAG